MIPKSSKLSEDLKQISDTINNFINDINEIINKLNKVKANLEIYLKLKTNIIRNFNNKYINYEILHNLKNINNGEILNSFNKIIKDKNVINKFQNIINIYEKMTNKIENINNDNININIQNDNQNIIFNANVSRIKFDEDINSSNTSFKELNLLKEKIDFNPKKENGNINNSKDYIDDELKNNTIKNKYR